MKNLKVEISVVWSGQELGVKMNSKGNDAATQEFLRDFYRDFCRKGGNYGFGLTEDKQSWAIVDRKDNLIVSYELKEEEQPLVVATFRNEERAYLTLVGKSPEDGFIFWTGVAGLSYSQASEMAAA